MEKNEIDEIAAMKLFNGIYPEDLDMMMQCIGPAVRKYVKNGIAALAGDSIPGVGVVMQGELEIMRENAAGNKMIMDIIGPGDVFGEMAAFSCKRIWPATVTARRESKVLFLPPDKFLGNCERSCAFHKRLIQNMLRIITEKAINLNRKVEYLGIKSMRGKICTYLLEQARAFNSNTFLLPLNKNELADFLNVSRPSMSREFSRLREEGVLDYYLSSIRIIDMDRLKEMTQNN